MSCQQSSKNHNQNTRLPWYLKESLPLHDRTQTKWLVNFLINMLFNLVFWINRWLGHLNYFNVCTISIDCRSIFDNWTWIEQSIHAIQFWFRDAIMEFERSHGTLNVMPIAHSWYCIIIINMLQSCNMRCNWLERSWQVRSLVRLCCRHLTRIVI